MTEQHVEVKRTKVKIKNGGRTAPQVIIDVDGVQHYLQPGQEVDVELPEPQAKRFQEVAKKGGGNLIIDGVDPADAKRRPDQPEAPPEHASRAAMAAKEAEVMKAGAEAGKKEEFALSGVDLAAESGIGAHAFGPGSVETITAPADAPVEPPAAKAKAHSSSAAAQPANSKK